MCSVSATGWLPLERTFRHVDRTHQWLNGGSLFVCRSRSTRKRYSHEPGSLTQLRYMSLRSQRPLTMRQEIAQLPTRVGNARFGNQFLRTALRHQPPAARSAFGTQI
jgi:hypothetical protein